MAGLLLIAYAVCGGRCSLIDRDIQYRGGCKDCNIALV